MKNFLSQLIYFGSRVFLILCKSIRYCRYDYYNL